MANNTINFTINLDGNAYTGIAQIDKALGNVLVSAKNTKSFFERIKSSAFDFNTITDAIGKVTQAFQTMVGTSLDFEQQQANLKTLLNGDDEATENLVSQIREYGKATVYDRGGLVEAQKTMMTFGLDAEFAFEKLKNIGDIALGDRHLRFFQCHKCADTEHFFLYHPVEPFHAAIAFRRPHEGVAHLNAQVLKIKPFLLGLIWGQYNNFQLSVFRFQFFCIFAALFVPKSGRAEGGRQTYIKGVESTSYLRLTNLANSLMPTR